MKTIILIACLTISAGWANEIVLEDLNSLNNAKLHKVYQALPKADVDDDGVLTLKELKAFADQTLKENATSRNHLLLMKVYRGERNADQNHDGILTKNELMGHFSEAASWRS